MPEPLRPYQLVGAQWLAARRLALLADVPRIGKSAQAIHACDLTNSQTILILCPAIARFNWLREFQKFSARDRTFQLVLSVKEPMRLADGIICSYNLAIESGWSTRLLAKRWDCAIVDESHYLGNYESQRSQLVWGKLVHQCRYIWCLTGTPARNHAAELWPVLRVFGVYGHSYGNFVNDFMVLRHSPYGPQIVGLKPEKADELQRMLAAIMLRRHLKDVLTELPEIEYQDAMVEPSPVDVRRFFPEVMLKRQTEDEMLARIASDLQAIDHTADYLGQYSDAAVTALSAFQSIHVNQGRRYTGLQKVPNIVQTVKTELADGAYEKIVLFAWHRDVIEHLRVLLVDEKAVTLYGGTTVHKREHAIREFHKNPRVKVIICNIAAASTNIDLSSTNEVAFVEASYVPSDNAQCVMRVYKFGQTLPVRVRFFNLPDSTDEKVHRILRRKTRDLVRLFGDGKRQAEDINPFAGCE